MSEATRAADRLAGKRWSGGVASRDRVAHLLGLDSAPEPFRVQSVAWESGRLEAHVATGQTKPLIIDIAPRDSNGSAFVLTDHLMVSYRGKNLPVEVGRAIHDHAPDRLAVLTPDDLAGMLLDDPDFVERPMPGTIRIRPAGQLDSWGSEDGWADFFAAGEIARARLDSIDPTRLFKFVQHGDTECSQVSPHGIAPVVMMVEYPWDDRIRNAGMPPYVRCQPRPKPGPLEDVLITTDLTEQDVIRGNPKKVEDILEDIVRDSGPAPLSVFFSNTCVPSVTGQDVESVVRRHASKSPFPILFLDVTPRSMLDVFRSLLVDRRKEAEAAAGAPDPATINLVGYPDTRATAEVGRMLEAFGVHVNCRFIPDIGEELIARLPNASLNVVMPNRIWQNLYDQVAEDTRTPSISPTAPYGREGSLRWAETIVRTLGLDVDVAAAWREYSAPFEPAWQRAIARASGHRLGFAMRGRDVHYLTDPADTWGIPLVQTIQEAGFGIDVLLRLTNPQDARSKAGEVAALFHTPHDHTILGFDSLEMMRSRLANSRCEAFLSHHFFDWRLGEAGKNRFSLRYFEIGLPGAIRTAERLTTVCATPFYRKYRRFLARTPEGLRAPPGQGVA
jgi:hypothetical protein